MIKKIIVFIVFVSTVAYGAVVLAAGDKLYFSGPKDSIAPGSTFSVSVLVDTTFSINAVNVEINFPDNQLQFLDFDNTDSIINIWQTKPEINQNGNLVFSGGMIKAFEGTAGLLGKITFQALSPGSPKLSFSKSDVYLADGKGTKVTLEASATTLSMEESAKIISIPVVSFQSTPEDVAIQQELDNFKSKMSFKRSLLFVLIGFILLSGSFLVYNRHKRKKVEMK